MFGRKCPSCAKKIDKKFNYCPYCGKSFRQSREEENYGILGKDDAIDLFGNQIKLPFGMGKIIGSMIKQLEKQLNEGEKLPRDFKIKITSGPQKQILRESKNPKIINPFSKEEFEKKARLPKVEADSKMRRLSDRVIYEIEVPGVKSEKEVLLTELVSGFEVKAYSNEKCFTKFIPFTEIIGHYVKNEKLFIELQA